MSAGKGTVVITTANCEVVLDSVGFYARCTSHNCTYVSEYTAAKHKARQWAEAHDNDMTDGLSDDLDDTTYPECEHTPPCTGNREDAPCYAAAQAAELSARRRAYRTPEWLHERNEDGYGTPNGHPFWETAGARIVGNWRVFERDGWTYGYDARHNGWWHFATPQEAAEHIAGRPAGIDMWA